MARGAHANKNWSKAEALAAESRRLAFGLLEGRKLDDEPNLPLALGASIEVNAHALANTGRLAEAVAFLKEELRAWNGTSMRARIQKNLHLLTLEGKPAPPLDTTEFVGRKRIKSLSDFKGRPVLLFLWAHWCGDCKAQGPILSSLRREYPKLALIAPTQRYGYVAGGEDAAKERETPYIAQVQRQFYPWMNDLPTPLSEENFRNYGVSTTPTVVLVDSQGIVRLYNPGRMTAEQLRPVLDKWAK
jgi:thiol-disulfide isomerase/thioredoxin